MAQMLMAAKWVLCLWLLCIAGKAKAQQYGGCTYGASQYNHNTCKKTKAATPLITANEKVPGTIKVYPNPAGKFFTLQLPSSYSNQQLMVQVYNTRQELVLSKRIVAKVLRHDIQLPILANGLYQVRVSSANTGQTLLLNIQN